MTLRDRQIDENTFFATDVEPGEYVLVKSETFNVECGAYAIDLGEGWLNVHLDLPDDHPAIADALGDHPGMSREHLEFYDAIAPEHVERPDGRPAKFWTRSITPAERAERARRRGFQRLSLPDLDAHLAGRRG